MTKYKIEFDRDACIGAYVCVAILPELWSEDERKAKLKGAVYNEESGKWELIVDEKDAKLAIESADSCPVLAITVTKVD